MNGIVALASTHWEAGDYATARSHRGDGGAGLLEEVAERDGCPILGRDRLDQSDPVWRREDIGLILMDRELFWGFVGMQSHAGMARQCPVVVMDDCPDDLNTKRLMACGVTEVLWKPLETKRLRKCLEAVLNLRGAKEEKEPRGKEGNIERPASSIWIGESRAAHEVFEEMIELALTDEPVLLRGETGTGKEIVARMLHELSRRADRALVTVDCPNIPSELFQSELFGYEKGSFSGADQRKPGLIVQAEGGTLFLDEIADIGLPHQTRLLRVLQEKSYRPVGSNQTKNFDARIIAATNADLEAAIEGGGFRRDLFYRMQHSEIVIPPLRERPDDIPPLVQYAFGKLAAQAGGPVPPVTKEAMARLQEHPWPGNVRELEGVASALWRKSRNGVIDAVLAGNCLPKSQPRSEETPTNPVPAAPTSKPPASDLEAYILERLERAAEGEKVKLWKEIRQESNELPMPRPTP